MKINKYTIKGEELVTIELSVGEAIRTAHSLYLMHLSSTDDEHIDTKKLENELDDVLSK